MFSDNIPFDDRLPDCELLEAVCVPNCRPAQPECGLVDIALTAFNDITWLALSLNRYLPVSAIMLLMSKVITMACASKGQDGTITTWPLCTDTLSVMYSMPLSTW